MTADADIASSVDLFGLHVDDLQSNVSITDGVVSGTLPYVTGYTGFSGDVSEQEGHFLALHFDAADTPGETITVELVGGASGPADLDADGLAVFQIAATTQKIKATASIDGAASQTIELALTGLTLEEEQISG